MEKRKRTITGGHLINRAYVAVLKTDKGVGVGIDVYKADDSGNHKTIYMASLFIPEQCGMRPAFIKGLQHIENELGMIPEIIKTNFRLVAYASETEKLKRKLNLDNLVIKDVYRPSRLGQAKDLAEDAVLRKTSISELIEEGTEVVV